MKTKVRAEKPLGRRSQREGLRMWSKLQFRMAISFLGVTVVIVLLLELLIVLTISLILTSPLVDDVVSNTAKQTAHAYALQAAVYAGGTTLDPRSTFQPGSPSSIALPGDDSSQRIPFISDGVSYISRSAPSQTVSFALLVAPNGRVLASSYPARYPVSTPVAHLLSKQAILISNALAGSAGNMVENTSQGHVVSTVEPVRNKSNQPIGAVYVQMPTGIPGDLLLSFVGVWARSAPASLLLLLPFGALFGLLTTRGIVRRIHRLVGATAEFANGDYTQRVPVTRRDEIGQLETQFNQMAAQMIASIEEKQRLTEQHARLEERARFEQELQTAQFIQRALLPKDMPALPGWRLMPFYRPAREVGGDLYDFIPFEDGRLGIVIGDVTDKGIPAALIMATTCTMLRTAAQATDSPGAVLARVNDLLYAETPSRMFVTCFYAILDPASGRMCYANAGHDLPYRRQANEVGELHARGMPLGLMPAMVYEEQEVILAPGEYILFYSDGLVEAHNPGREMFGFPRLKTLLAEHADWASLIDYLLNELKGFTGEAWEQEDDVTLVTLQRTQTPKRQEE
ncbi:MAG: HAMP domain-containing protein [Chloroflexi bacterium]|nr:MAG: HAMP domain-containing protein [Chloroflexota bacterium]